MNLAHQIIIFYGKALYTFEPLIMAFQQAGVACAWGLGFSSIYYCIFTAFLGKPTSLAASSGFPSPITTLIPINFRCRVRV